MLEHEFRYYANEIAKKSISYKHENQDRKLIEIVWRPDDHPEAMVLFDTISQAEETRLQMNGNRLPDRSSQALRIDFADPKVFKAKKKLFGSYPRDTSTVSKERQQNPEEYYEEQKPSSNISSLSDQSNETRQEKSNEIESKQELENDLKPETDSKLEHESKQDLDQETMALDLKDKLNKMNFTSSNSSLYISLAAPTSSKSVISAALMNPTDSNYDFPGNNLMVTGGHVFKKKPECDSSELKSIIITTINNIRRVDKVNIYLFKLKLMDSGFFYSDL